MMHTGPVVWIDQPIIVEADAGCIKLTSRSGGEVRIQRVSKHIATRLQHELRIVLQRAEEEEAEVFAISRQPAPRRARKPGNSKSPGSPA